MQIDLYASIYGICEAHNLTIAMLVLTVLCPVYDCIILVCLDILLTTCVLCVIFANHMSNF